MDLDNYISNVNSPEYKKYLEKYKKIIENKTKCLKSKKCNPELIVNNNELILDKGKKEQEKLKLPDYILVDEKIKEIKEELLLCDKKIRYNYNFINKNVSKTIIEDYKKTRERYFELEKELDLYENYLNKVNNFDEKNNKKKELEKNLLEIEIEKRKLFNKIKILHILKKKGDKKFDQNLYEEIIKKYLDNKEYDEMKNELNKINKYILISDNLYSKKDRDENTGKIDYIVKSINSEKKIKLKKPNEQSEKKIKLKK